MKLTHRIDKRLCSFWITEREHYIIERLAARSNDNVSAYLRATISQTTDGYPLTAADLAAIKERISKKRS